MELDLPLALEAADAIVHATALHHRGELATTVSCLKGLRGVKFIGMR